MSSGIKIVSGAGNYGRDFKSDVVPEVFDILEAGGVHTIDTAALYGPSEETLGEHNAAKRFTVDTKVKGGFGGPGHATKKNVIAEAENSKKFLGEVDILYIHAPDADTPLEETLEGINEVFKSGFFKRFGLSNFKVEDVQKAYDICKGKGHGFVPSVYQGNYSAIARKQEEVLFPTLRKLGIAFYAYSPMAGGFLTKTRKDIEEGKGRFDQSTSIGKMYGGMYSKPSYLDALSEWERIAKEEGVSRGDLAYRWVRYNSPLKSEYGDAIIVGASSITQLKDTLGLINKGPLSEKAVKDIDAIWETVKHEAPLDNYHK